MIKSLLGVFFFSFTNGLNLVPKNMDHKFSSFESGEKIIKNNPNKLDLDNPYTENPIYYNSILGKSASFVGGFLENLSIDYYFYGEFSILSDTYGESILNQDYKGNILRFGRGNNNKGMIALYQVDFYDEKQIFNTAISSIANNNTIVATLFHYKNTQPNEGYEWLSGCASISSYSLYYEYPFTYANYGQSMQLSSFNNYRYFFNNCYNTETNSIVISKDNRYDFYYRFFDFINYSDNSAVLPFLYMGGHTWAGTERTIRIFNGWIKTSLDYHWYNYAYIHILNLNQKYISTKGLEVSHATLVNYDEWIVDKFYLYNSVNNYSLTLDALKGSIDDDGNYFYFLDNKRDVYSEYYQYSTAYNLYISYDYDVTQSYTSATQKYSGISALNLIGKSNYNSDIGAPDYGYLNTSFDLINLSLSGLVGIFGLVILPGITLGGLVLVPLLATLLIFVIKLFKR